MLLRPGTSLLPHAGLVSMRHGRKVVFKFAVPCVFECSLSMDNDFVYMHIFKHFRIAESGQETKSNRSVPDAVILRGAAMFPGPALEKSST